MKRWGVVVVFAAAMAWLEAAVVFYLRTLVGRLEPYQPHPLPLDTGFEETELIRELATMVMLWAIGWLAGNSRRARWAFSVIAFGVWDISYYVFLRIICGWPKTLFDWDVLFLIPLPWWGPVLAPMLIAALMIGWGTLAVISERCDQPRARSQLCWWFALIGSVLALEVFMHDALTVIDRGAEAWGEVLPMSFNWPLFLVALALMSAPLLKEIFAALVPKPQQLAAIGGEYENTCTSAMVGSRTK